MHTVPGQRAAPGGVTGRTLSDFPLLSDVRDSLVRWNDPTARHARRKRRASRALSRWIALTLLSGVAVLAGVLTGPAASAPVFLGLAGIIVFGALGTRSGMRVRRLNREQVRPPRAITPSAGSAAYRPMHRLTEAESSLEQLLDQLASAQGDGAAVSSASVAEVRSTADSASDTLRGLAVRIETIERARNAAPEPERPALDSAVGTVTRQLEDGLDAYGSLVAAAGHALAASHGTEDGSWHALGDATDRLAGLAIALRELG